VLGSVPVSNNHSDNLQGSVPASNKHPILVTSFLSTCICVLYVEDAYNHCLMDGNLCVAA
jgi:hypothetical protein